jgi:hypothetical protein
MIQMKLIASSVGLGIPKTDLGLTLASGTYISFDINGEIVIFGMAKAMSPSRSSSFVGAQIDTNWFSISDEHKINILSCSGKLAQLEISGLVPLFGEVDISFTVYDQYNSTLFSIERVKEPARGVMPYDFKIRDVLKKLK